MVIFASFSNEMRVLFLRNRYAVHAPAVCVRCEQHRVTVCAARHGTGGCALLVARQPLRYQRRHGHAAPAHHSHAPCPQVSTDVSHILYPLSASKCFVSNVHVNAALE